MFRESIRYFINQDNSNIRRIVFVLPSGEEGPPDPDERPIRPDDRPTDEPLDYDKGEPDDLQEGTLLTRPGQQRQVKIGFLRSGRAIRKLQLWEFVPYNVAKPKSFDSEFIAAAIDLRDRLLTGISENE